MNKESKLIRGHNEIFEGKKLWAQTPNKRYDEPNGWPYGCQIEMLSIL